MLSEVLVYLYRKIAIELSSIQQRIVGSCEWFVEIRRSGDMV